MNTTKRSIGCYLAVIVGALAIAGFALNGGVANSIQLVSTLLIIAAVIEIVGFVLSFAAGPRPVYNLISIVSSVLIGYALTVSFGAQMNQLGNVVAGLDTADSLSTFFTFVGITAAALLVSIVSSFMGKAKSA